MKKSVIFGILFCFLASLAFAQGLTLKGAIIDNMCASTQSQDNLGEFVKTHTKECALMPACVASGYSIFAEGKLYKLNADSNAKVTAFLAGADSKLDVVVTGDEVDGELNVVEIQNQ